MSPKLYILFFPLVVAVCFVFTLIFGFFRYFLPKLIKLFISYSKYKKWGRKNKKYQQNKANYVSQDKEETQEVLEHASKYYLLDANNPTAEICECCKAICNTKNVHGVFLCQSCEDNYNELQKNKLQKTDLENKPAVAQVLQFYTDCFNQHRAKGTDKYCYTCRINISNEEVMGSTELGTHRYCRVCAHNEYKFKHLIPSIQDVTEKYKRAKKLYSKIDPEYYDLADYQIRSLVGETQMMKMMSESKYICTEFALITPNTMHFLTYSQITKIQYVLENKWIVELSSGKSEILKNVTNEEMIWFLYNYSDKLPQNFKIYFGGKLYHIYYSLLKEYSKQN